ncbi:MAG: hypothetical protein ACODAE_00450 [Gemmatimonadota bacterium]
MSEGRARSYCVACVERDGGPLPLAADPMFRLALSAGAGPERE